MTERQRILDRLAKLLAMSKSSNKHESDTAMRMAEALAKVHGVAFSEVENHTIGGLYEKPMGAKGFEKVWKFSLVTATSRFCGCEAIALWAGERCKVRLVGERLSVEEAAELFAGLLESMNGLVKEEAEWLERQSLVFSVDPKAYVDSFRRGVTSAIIDKMKRLRAGSRAEPEDVVPVNSEPVDAPKQILSRSLVRVKRPAGKTAEFQEKVKSKYAPKKTTVSLGDAEDEGAFWRGYQLALARIEMTPLDPKTKNPG
jgi:hypothetical protein